MCSLEHLLTLFFTCPYHPFILCIPLNCVMSIKVTRKGILRHRSLKHHNTKANNQIRRDKSTYLGRGKIEVHDFGLCLNSLPTLLTSLFIQVHDISKAFLSFDRKRRERETDGEVIFFFFRAEKTLC